MAQLIITTTVPETLSLDLATVAAMCPEHAAGEICALANLIAYQADSQPGRPVVELDADLAPGAEYGLPAGSHAWPVIPTRPRVLRLSLPEDVRRRIRDVCYALHGRLLNELPRIDDEWFVVRAARMAHDWLWWDLAGGEVDPVTGRTRPRSV